MITVKEVKTKKDIKAFLDFPLELYKNCEYFVPPLYGDEKKMFLKNFVYNDTCESVFFLAESDGKTVGRISGIIQKASNEKNNEKRVRFTRFDAIDDVNVSSALFSAVESWAKNKGMTEICGPLGYSDLEREGLLIYGFNELSTFEEQYNYDYYPALVEAYGFKKEVDWEERKLYAPDVPDEKLYRVSDMMLKKLGLRFATCKSVNEFLNRYGDKIFALLDESYDHLYGTVPFTDGMKKMMIANFKLIVDLKYVNVIVDENDNVACFGVCFPSIGKAVQKSGGKLTLPCIIRVLKALKKPEVLDLALIGVKPEYLRQGVSSALIAAIMKMLENPAIDHAETNLNLEDNLSMINQWKRFKEVLHKKRRSYVKTID